MSELSHRIGTALEFARRQALIIETSKAVSKKKSSALYNTLPSAQRAIAHAPIVQIKSGLHNCKPLILWC